MSAEKAVASRLNSPVFLLIPVSVRQDRIASKKLKIGKQILLTAFFCGLRKLYQITLPVEMDTKFDLARFLTSLGVYDAREESLLYEQSRPFDKKKADL